EAEALCDRLAIMDHGKILDSGTVDDLIGRRFRERGVHFRRAGAPDKDKLEALPAVSRVVYEEDEVVLYTGDVPATIGGLLELTRRASLEDVFLDLTGRALRD